MTPTPHGPWQIPESWPTLAENEVHVWLATLDVPEDVFQRLADTLSGDEADRAKAFRFDYHRRDFIVARGLLRVILARYVGISPTQIGFTYSDHGKPALQSVKDQQLPCFNLSHAHRLALYGVTFASRIGLDIEWINREVDCEEVAKVCFSAQERELLQALPAPSKLPAFFNGWTRKEAFLKALGRGLSIDLKRIEVTITPGDPAAWIGMDKGIADSHQWRLYPLEPPEGYAGALVVESPARPIRTWQWAPRLLTSI